MHESAKVDLTAWPEFDLLIRERLERFDEWVYRLVRVVEP
jgi:hypothetical protein